MLEVVDGLITAKGTPPVWLMPIAVSRLVTTMTDLALIEKVVIETEAVVDFGDLITRLGRAALPLVHKIVQSPRESHELKGVASALAAVGSLEHAEILASAIQHAPMRKVAADYFHRFPEHAAPLRERRATHAQRSSRRRSSRSSIAPTRLPVTRRRWSRCLPSSRIHRGARRGVRRGSGSRSLGSRCPRARRPSRRRRRSPSASGSGPTRAPHPNR